MKLLYCKLIGYCGVVVCWLYVILCVWLSVIATGYINADYPGIYLPKASIGDKVEEGEVVGQIVDPLTGAVRQEMKAPIKGMVFTVREYPIVYSGSLLNRILGGVE